jgi:hypothetical protein
MGILEWILGKQGEKLWTGCVLLQCGEEWRTFVSTVVNIRVSFLVWLGVVDFSGGAMLHGKRKGKVR